MNVFIECLRRKWKERKLRGNARGIVERIPAFLALLGKIENLYIKAEERRDALGTQELQVRELESNVLGLIKIVPGRNFRRVNASGK